MDKPNRPSRTDVARRRCLPVDERLLWRRLRQYREQCQRIHHRDNRPGFDMDLPIQCGKSGQFVLQCCLPLPERLLRSRGEQLNGHPFRHGQSGVQLVTPNHSGRCGRSGWRRVSFRERLLRRGGRDGQRRHPQRSGECGGPAQLFRNSRWLARCTGWLLVGRSRRLSVFMWERPVLGLAGDVGIAACPTDRRNRGLSWCRVLACRVRWGGLRIWTGWFQRVLRFNGRSTPQQAHRGHRTNP